MAYYIPQMWVFGWEMRVLGNIPWELNCLYSDSGLGVEQGTEGKGGIGLGENLCHLFLPLPNTYLLSGSDESVIPPVGSAVWISITTPLGRTGRGSVKDWSTLAKLFYLLCATRKRRYCLKIPADARPAPVLQRWLFSYCQWADRCH